LMPLVKREDIVFASPSEDLGCYKIASKLKKSIGMRYVVNLHDPLSFSIVNGKKVGSRPHANREKSEQRYLGNADLIITCSMTYCNALKSKYHDISDRIINSYFGYIREEKLGTKKFSNKIRVAYGGTFGRAQQPETLAQAVADLENVEIYYIGNHKSYKPLQPFRSRCVLVENMSNNDYNKFMMDNIDVGFVSLSKVWYGACVPSKIFEYINLGLPILGALPDGDAKDIINHHGYGVAVNYNDRLGLKKALNTFLDRERYLVFKNKLIQDRKLWSIERHCHEIYKYLIK